MDSFELAATDADWFETTPPAIDPAERNTILRVAHEKREQLRSISLGTAKMGPH
jgi:hypothetical protein